jgi:hypothetical protein
MEERPDAIEGGNFFLGVMVSIGLMMAGIAFGYMIYYFATKF